MPEQFSVLIVEDDDDARSNMEDILSIDGYQIETVSHCLPAINAIESRQFDSIIVDWRLPDGNGGDLINAIKRQVPDMPVVVVTGAREFDTAVTALRRGVYDFLTKPINPDALRSLLSRLVERKQHLAEIESAQEKVLSSERLAAIGQMVTGLAHESRNAFQRSHACLAELSLDLEEMPESLKLVLKVQKALDDVNQLLEEVRNYAAPIVLERRDCDLPELVRESWQQILDAKGAVDVQIEIKTGNGFPKTIRGDRNRFVQVFRNLLENAWFAMTELGTIVVSFDLAQKKQNSQMVSISFSDDGKGVDAENRDEIFAPFFTTKTKGTGLGLAICRRIVEAHNGTLFVTDAETGGAKFVVELPAIHKS